MRKRLRLGPRKTSDERAQIVAARAQSPLCNRDFAAAHGIAVSTLYRWQHQFSADHGIDRAHLIEVPNLLSAGPALRTYRLQLPNGSVLEIASGFVRDELHALRQLLRGL